MNLFLLLLAITESLPFPLGIYKNKSAVLLFCNILYFYHFSLFRPLTLQSSIIVLRLPRIVHAPCVTAGLDLEML